VLPQTLGVAASRHVREETAKEMEGEGSSGKVVPLVFTFLDLPLLLYCHVKRGNA